MALAATRTVTRFIRVGPIPRSALSPAVPKEIWEANNFAIPTGSEECLESRPREDAGLLLANAQATLLVHRKPVTPPSCLIPHASVRLGTRPHKTTAEMKSR